MAIIDCVSWSPQGNAVIYAYKYPQDNLSTYTQLIVNESQWALLFSKGELMGKFGPGKHTLNTENLPILRKLYGFPFGGKNPFTAQVWFVNRIESMSIPWKLTNLPIHDPDYQTNLPLAADGQYGLKVVDPEKFLIKMVGTRNQFNQADMTQQFTGEFTTKAKSLISSYMLTNHVGFKQISAFLDPLSQELHTRMNEFWEKFGIELTKFYVSNIEIDDSTPEGAKVKQAIATQSSMSITGHTWQQEQMFGTANSAINQMSNFGGGGNGTGGLLGGLMAINMMNNVTGNMGGGMMNPQYAQPTFGGGGNGNGMGANAMAQAQANTQAVRTVFCAKCSKKFTSNNAFCPHCGNKYNPCPKCGSDNPEAARRCMNCGTQLSGADKISCPHCRTEVPQGCAFCPGCGQPVLQAPNTCSRCGAELLPSAKFCPKCGMKKA